ncbi:MAG: T9SS type A sorting domain-containing protein [Chryseobacterium sp.]|nr:T9SS type A sorting domain-containing protein [Chryseobacterium sp.]
MKAKLLLAASLFAVVAQAQLTSINEDFNNFTAGNATFPQNGWSAILPTGPFPPQPMMLVVAADATNKVIQAYPGSSSNQPLYLVTPQIVAPAGDKAISFDTGLVASSPGTTTVQVGVASSPTDMTTFVAIGDPIQITSTTIQNVKVNVPLSTGTYLVIRHTPTAAHTALQIDNVKYDTNLAVNESAFNSSNVKFAVSADNSTLRFVSPISLSNAKIYSASGQLVKEGKINDNSFEINGLRTGVYFIVLENKDGQTVRSKFIKK